MILRYFWSFAGALALAAVIGSFVVPMLRRIKAGQQIREDGPVWHMSKQGTPTMGGIVFIAAIVIILLCSTIKEMIGGEFAGLIALGLALIYGGIGFLDDYEKLKKKQNLGLTAAQKFLLQLVVAIAFILLMRKLGYISPALYVPFFEVTIQLPEVVYFVFAAFVIVGTVNAVNLTDGVDGLASGVTIPVALFYMAVSFVWGYTTVGILAGAMAGGLAGFLIFNFHPAKVFMGDTGSLFLGGAVCALAFALNMPLILVLVGIVYILETMSDIIQVTYFKLTHGKRIFKMAPLHHHFEMCGWSEKKVFTVFTTVSALFCVLAYFAVRNRYGI